MVITALECFFFFPESSDLFSCRVLLNFAVSFVPTLDGFSESESDMPTLKIPFICQPIFCTNSYIHAFHCSDCTILFSWSTMVIYFFLCLSYCCAGFYDEIESSSADLPWACWQPETLSLVFIYRSVTRLTVKWEIFICYRLYYRLHKSCCNCTSFILSTELFIFAK